ncbi:MAG: SOUL family heme-binding protein [Alphaproteobacteria bacterium]
MQKNLLIFAIVMICITALLAWGPVMSQVEQAKYSVVEVNNNIEIRDYAPMIAAEVEVSGEREKAINQGFRMIADYIFGNNVTAQKLAMTAPVVQQSAEKIAMTAPVIQQANNNGSWMVRFIMPSEKTMQTLPTPNNTVVKLQEIPAKRYVAIRFSGLGSEKNLEKYTNELKVFMAEKKLVAVAMPSYAFYNPPWTLPMLRRNEIMMEIEK